MYSEFIIIYVLLLAIIALLITVLVVTLKSSNGRSAGSHNSNFGLQAAPPANPNNGYTEMKRNDSFDNNIKNTTSPQKSAVNSGVVFCTKCAHQYSANDKFCPNCGHARN